MQIIDSNMQLINIKQNNLQCYFKQKIKFMLINLFILIFILSLLFTTVNTTYLQGCSFDETLCKQTEICLRDGLFGQCYSEINSESFKPLIIEKELDPFQQEIFRLELKRLTNNGLTWLDAQTQCIFAYFKLTVVYDLNYDSQFCLIRNPENIWPLIQKMQNILTLENNKDKNELNISDLFLNNEINNYNDETIKLKLKTLQQQLQENTSNNKEVDLDIKPIKLIVEEQNEPQQLIEEPELIQQEKYYQNKIIPAILVDNNQPLLLDDKNKIIEQPIENKLIIAVDEPDTQEDLNQSLLKEILKQTAKRSIENDKADLNYETSNNQKEPLVIFNKSDFENYNKQLVRNAWLDQLILKLFDTSLRKINIKDDKQLDDYVIDILNNNHPNFKNLKDNQLDKLVALINSLKLILQKRAIELEKDDISSTPELEEIIPLTSQNNEQQLLLKKDIEKFNNADMGLSNTVHKIEKGDTQRIKSNRVYLKVALPNKKKLSEKELYGLINYLNEKIAQPNNLFFDQFAYENGQLSFCVSLIKFTPNLQNLIDELNIKLEPNDFIDIENNYNDKNEKINDNLKKKIETQLESVSGVARAIYKRRSDIHNLSGIDVDETGIGSGVHVMPIKSSHNNYFEIALIGICGLTMGLVFFVLAIKFKKELKNKKIKDNGLLKIIDNLEGKLSKIYEDLCRQRMNSQDKPISVNVYGSSDSVPLSKYSRSELESLNLDISTGHIILNFLKDCLEKPEEITNQWKQLFNYKNTNKKTTIATELNNLNKNYDNTILPYDDSLVIINELQKISPKKILNNVDGTVLVDLTNKTNDTNYINASKIFDADPRQILYIAAQSPLEQTCNTFWQMIWQENIVLIVNLCNQENYQQLINFVKYWPDEGSKVFDIFEVNLVSEHIWNEDYVVRSLYLKNLSTNETRTVTQFHYLAWPENSLPKSIKSLLEFRKKVNKSYRGHSSPVLVHCTNGSGRTGTYCLIDMVINRILKGVKELNIAGSLEHMRDQRMKMVENEEQYKLVFQCVAEEVSMLLENLQN